MKTAIDNPSNQFFVSDLIDHYLVTELSEQTNWHSHSTRIVYRVFLNPVDTTTLGFDQHS
jgi:hypothetical protein